MPEFKLPQTPKWGPVIRLILATASWGLSFPVAKALLLLQARVLPGYPSMVQASLVLMNRMWMAAAVTGLMVGRRLWRLRRCEIQQGLELGVYGGVGMLFQTHAQTLIPASTSAFFTQFTCVFVPLVVAIRARSLPGARTSLACFLVLCGCGLISGFHGEAAGLGGGEMETILAAALFTGQILALEREAYRSNDMLAVAAVMFAVKGGLFSALPFLALNPELGPQAWASLYGSAPMWAMLSVLGVFSTAYGYGMMLLWQPRISATQAGVIYATEPVFATAWALVLPEWISGWAGVVYANERPGLGFVFGALLVLGANALLLAPAPEPAPTLKPACSGQGSPSERSNR